MGAKIQVLYSIALQFTAYLNAFTTDILIYCQVKINQDDRRFQQILRRSVEESLRMCEAATVKYATTLAPYLATRLQQFAENESKDFSLAPEALMNNLMCLMLFVGPIP
jgi:hypothetical protein